MASKASPKKPAAAAKPPAVAKTLAKAAAKVTDKVAAKVANRVAANRERKNDKHAQQAVERFKTSSRGFRGVFNGHFPGKTAEIEALAFHLAQFEAQVPNAVEAIRLARYPGAGNRNPKRMALGLCENLSAIHTHLTRSIKALEAIANGKHIAPPK